MKTLKVEGNNSRQKIVLYGDKNKQTEPPEVSIEFPGGVVSVCRTMDGNYWMHFSAHHDEKGVGKYGKVIDARVDFDDGRQMNYNFNSANFNHMAILVEPQAVKSLEERSYERTKNLAR